MSRSTTKWKNARGIAFDDRVRALDRAFATSPSANEATSSPTRNSIRAAVGCGGNAIRIAPASQPGSSSSSRVGGPERARAPVREHVHDRAKLQSVLGQLVDGRRGGRREAPPRDDSVSLEVLEPGSEDVRPAAVEAGVEVRVPELAVLEKLTDDEQRPALADHVEGVCDRAVLVVALHRRLRIVHARCCEMEVLTCNLKVNAASIPAFDPNEPTSARGIA